MSAPTNGATAEDPVLYSTDGPIAWVVLNRPNQRNAINRAMRLAFRDAFAQAEQDTTVKVIVVSGAGDRAFCAGADLKEIGTRTPMQRRAMSDEEPSAVVRAATKPVIAAIRGYAVGGGLELASTCDMRVSSDTAIFAYPEIKHGWFPAGGGTQSLPRLVGMGLAMELILTGRQIGADEALARGLVNSVHPDSELDVRVRELAESVAKHRLGALVLAKAAVRMSERAGTDLGHLYEKELGALAYTFDDRAEALAAFAEGRDPEFKD